jgi:hypothetical protein
MSRSSPTPRDSRSLAQYDDDFFAWTQETAALLRAGRLADVDVAHVAEEIEDMGKRELRELNGRMQVLLVHLLKWQLQPDRRTPSWRRTIVTQRAESEALVRDSPSLEPKLESDFAGNYARAVRRTSLETELPVDRFPTRSPLSLEQVLADEFFPT